VAAKPFLDNARRGFFFDKDQEKAMSSIESVLDRRRGKLMLADGTRFDGFLVGAGELPVWGEVVFNTSMTGYQEVISDPSYAGQIVVMTYPQIGNYGVSSADNEGTVCAARALVMRELSAFFSPAPGRISLETFMAQRRVCGFTGVDTRAITRRVRSGGAVMAAIGTQEVGDAELLEIARSRSFSRGESLVESVSGSIDGPASGAGRESAAVIDLGIKRTIFDRIGALGVGTRVFDASFEASEILDGGFDFVVLSNGPGDPSDVPGVIRQTKCLIGRIPLLGICLGHQVTALAMGGHTYKMKFGHHGANQPVVDNRTGRVFITSQNHGYAVSDDISRLDGVEVTYTNANDGTLEGFADKHRKVECVQFHPEASPGPHDTEFIIGQFFDKVKGWRNAEKR
jgi:carbamoyl-phosphate synthase small subunit